MGNHCCNKMSSSRNSSNSKLDSKLDSMKFEPPKLVGLEIGMDMGFAPTWLRPVSPVLHMTTLTTGYSCTPMQRHKDSCTGCLSISV